MHEPRSQNVQRGIELARAGVCSPASGCIILQLPAVAVSLATSLIPPMRYERLHNAYCAEYLMASEINDDREVKTRERRHVASQGISRVRARLPSSGRRSDREEEPSDAP